MFGVVEIEEQILTYEREQLTTWVEGDKSLLPGFAELPAILSSQPSFHFAEALTLRYYHQTAGWLGFAHYAIGPQYPRSARRRTGREKLREVIPRSDLEAFLAMRAARPSAALGKGEPDLFLWKPDRSFMFVEVKGRRDTMKAEQLSCITHILRALRCPVHVVYAREVGERYDAKRYRFDLDAQTAYEVA